MNMYTVRYFAKAIKFGSKYVYQTIPRLLTIWLDMGENRTLANGDLFIKLNAIMSKAIKETPVYKVFFTGIIALFCSYEDMQWFTAFPQIVSRVGHHNQDVFTNLSKLITAVIQEYPNQALWLFTSVVKSTKPNREQRGRDILKGLQVSLPQIMSKASGIQLRPYLHLSCTPTTQEHRCQRLLNSV
jgi:serine/threonine-protein kinase ATR